MTFKIFIKDSEWDVWNFWGQTQDKDMALKYMKVLRRNGAWGISIRRT